MFKGSRNSMSYLKPKSWWMRLIWFFTRRQKADYITQYVMRGIRIFELNIYCDRQDTPIFKQGLVKSNNVSLYTILDFLDNKGDAYVILNLNETLWDTRNAVECISVEKRFKELCKICERIYENIVFMGGKRAYDGETIYDFGTPIRPIPKYRMYCFV